MSLGAAAGIGLWQIAAGKVSPWLLLAIPIGAVLAAGYGLEWPGLHGHWQFAAWWGVFPLLVGYLAQSTSWDWSLLPASALAFLSASAQRVLSARARYLRRRVAQARVLLQERGHHGATSQQTLDKGWLLAAEERALMLWSLALPLAALALVMEAVWR